MTLPIYRGFCVRLVAHIKKQLLACEQERSDVKFEREAWKEHRLSAINRAIEKVIFIDETCTKTNMTPFRGRAIKGKRLIAHAPSGKWQTITFIAGLRYQELTAPFCLKGQWDGVAFETYVKTQRTPTLQKGNVVICDNLNVHKSKKARERIEAKGALLLFLPRSWVPLKRRSQSSKPCCERQKHEIMKACGKLSAISATSSHRNNASTISNLADMNQYKRTML